MVNKKVVGGCLILWLLLVTLAFTVFGYEIDQFNAKVRNFLVHGVDNVRTFGDDGIPTSHSVKYQDGFISPFYVVHYGLMYSEAHRPDNKSSLHWTFDGTVPLWNVPPKNIELGFFKSAADWVVDNMAMFKGKYHLLYNFDWLYKGFPNGGLKSPWYSGLTDGYAILLLLRAHDVFGEAKYLDSARKLYKSVVSSYWHGGSLTTLNSRIWIEEYVQPDLDTDQMAFVLNGMVYAAYGVLAYETYENTGGISTDLFDSIEANLSSFSKGTYWSTYDLIGDVSNIKYHRIHVGLLEEMEHMGLVPSSKIRPIIENWQVGAAYPGFFWVVHGNWSWGYFHFLGMYFSIMVAPFAVWFFLVFLNSRQTKSRVP